MSDKKLFAVRVRGTIGLKMDDKKTLAFLKLEKTNACALLPDLLSNRNMLRTVSHIVTWGEATDAEVVKTFTSKKVAKSTGTNPIQFTNLAPPRGGFERKGVKQQFSVGGAVGYRGDKISLLVKRMM